MIVQLTPHCGKPSRSRLWLIKRKYNSPLPGETIRILFMANTHLQCNAINWTPTTKLDLFIAVKEKQSHMPVKQCGTFVTPTNRFQRCLVHWSVCYAITPRRPLTWILMVMRKVNAVELPYKRGASYRLTALWTVRHFYSYYTAHSKDFRECCLDLFSSANLRKRP